MGSCSTSWSRAGGDKRAAKRLLRKLLKRQTRVPRVMITDELASFSARRETGARGRASPAQGPDDRAENSYQPSRQPRQIKRFKSAGQAQRFLSAHDQINNLFPSPPRAPPCRPISSRPYPSLPDLGRGHRRCRSGIGVRVTVLHVRLSRPEPIKLTVPWNLISGRKSHQASSSSSPDQSGRRRRLWPRRSLREPTSWRSRDGTASTAAFCSAGVGR